MKTRNRSSQPIGVFDSGLGGLTVVRSLRRVLPHEHIIYFGDLARLPYGTKSKKQIIEFSLKNAEFLLTKQVKAIVVACNSSASCAPKHLKKKYDIPIIDVIRATVVDAIGKTKNKRIGIIGTTATIESGVYQRLIQKYMPDVKVYTQGCPLFVPLVEEGWLQTQITSDVVEKYLGPLRKKSVDVLILGCTHYPLLRRVIQRIMGSKTKLIESAPSTVTEIRAALQSQKLLRTSGKGKLTVYVSDKSPHFTSVGSRVLGAPLQSVKMVTW